MELSFFDKLFNNRAGMGFIFRMLAGKLPLHISGGKTSSHGFQWCKNFCRKINCETE